MSQSPDNKLSIPPEYWEVRSAITSLFRKVMRDPSLAVMSMLKAAKRLGIRTAGKTIVFQDRTDQAALADYFFHEYAVEGKTALQNINPSTLDLTPLEGELLEAARQSSTSLFRTLESFPDRCQLRILDMLEPEASEVTITDIGLSQTYAHWAAKGLVYVRLMKVRDMLITGGFSYVFSPEHSQRMMQSLFQKTKNKTEEEWPEFKAQFFLQMQRRYGVPGRYLDSDFSPPVPTAPVTPEPPSAAPQSAAPTPPAET